MNKEQKEYLNWLNETTDLYRGKFINKAIYIEQIIDEFLGWYFIGENIEKRIQFKQLVLTSPFAQKINLFRKILKILDHDSEESKQLFSDIEKLREKRNEFAHSKIDSRLESLSERSSDRTTIYLIKLSDYEINNVILTISSLDNELNGYASLIETFANILKKYTEPE